MPTRTEVIEYARTLKGTPFHHQGRIPGVGIDCIGTLLVPLWRFGLMTDVDLKGYSRTPSPEQLYAFLRNVIDAGHAWTIPKEERLPADVLLIRVGNDPQHFAWCTDIGMLHAVCGLGKKNNFVTEHSIDPEIEKAVIQVYRIRGIE